MRKTWSLALAISLIAAPGAAHAENVDVNLWVGNDNVQLAAGESGAQTIEIGNRGPAAHSGPLVVRYTTPFFWNAVEADLPKDCSYLLKEKRAFVPEVVECKLSGGVAKDESVTLEIPLTVVAGGPIGSAYGQVNVAPGAANELDFSDNWTATGVTVLGDPAAPPGPERPNLYLTAKVPYVPSNTVTPLEVTVGNNEHAAATIEPATLTFVAPFYVHNAVAGGLPEGCEYLLSNKNSAVPEVVLCQLGPGVRRGEVRTLTFPIESPPEGPHGMVTGRGLVTSPGEANLADNILDLNVQLGP